MDREQFESTANQKEIRRRLFEVLKSHPMDQKDMAQKIGISLSTLHRFWTLGNNLNFLPLCRVNAFVESMEKQ